MEFHRFQIKNKNPKRAMSGLTTEILMDGKPIAGCVGFNFRVRGGEIATVSLDLIGSVEIDGIAADDTNPGKIELDASLLKSQIKDPEAQPEVFDFRVPMHSIYRASEVTYTTPSGKVYTLKQRHQS